MGETRKASAAEEFLAGLSAGSLPKPEKMKKPMKTPDVHAILESLGILEPKQGTQKENTDVEALSLIHISINPQWSTVSHTRLVTATEKVFAIIGIENIEQDTTEREVITMGILEGFEVVNLVAAKGASTCLLYTSV